MKKTLKYWWLFLLKGLIFLVLAIYVFTYPVSALVGVALYIGISLLMTGMFLVIIALSSRDVLENWGWRLAEGIIDILFAFVMLSNPGLTASVLPFVVGFWAMVYGVMLFADSFQVKKAGDANWWIGLLTGLLTILMGYFITSNLLAGAIAITYWIAFAFILAGIANIFIANRMRSLKSAAE